jgi:polar amino acid transport system substrate-binding protein
MKKLDPVFALRDVNGLVRRKNKIWRKARQISLFLLLITTGFSGAVNGAEKLVLEKQTIVLTTIFPPNMAFFSEMSALYKEAFSRMGHRFKLISQPGERAMIDANEGVVDGEAARIMDIDMERYPNLVRVPHPIVTIQVGAYATDTSIKIEGWKSLVGNPYRVGLVKGIKSTEQKLPLYVDKKYIVSISGVEQSMKMLKAKRIDVFIVGTQVEDTSYMKSGAYEEVKCVGIVETKVLFPWLHKRHQQLVHPLADMLKTIKLEGRF